MDVQKITKRPPFYIFRHYATYRKLQKNFEKTEFFFSIFSFLRAYVVSSCRKSGFRFRALDMASTWAVPGLFYQNADLEGVRFI